MKRVISFKILGSGIFLVGILYVYSSLSSRIPSLKPFLLSSLPPFLPSSVFFFILYCSIGIIVLTLIFRNRYNRILQSIIIGIICFLLIGYGSFALGISTAILFYILSAYAEEYLKYNTGNNLLMEEKRKEQTDIILFCILIALGFSLTENLVYIVSSIFQHQGTSLISLSIGRGVISSLIHVVSTGLIAFISLRFPKIGTTTVPMIIGLLL
jgi:RsiW-degrading membrane proteinase PrsW (M82 family)